MQSHKRAKFSDRLLPYNVVFREANEPKYDFFGKFTPRKRKWPNSKCAPQGKSGIMRVLEHNKEQIMKESTESFKNFEGDDVNMQDDGTLSNDFLDGGAMQNTGSPQNSTALFPEGTGQDEVEMFTTSDVTQYSLLLQQENAVSFCNYSATGFVLQDYNAAIKRLKRKYVTVERRGMKFTDGCKWIYWCSQCDQHMACMVKTLHYLLEQSSTEFQFPSCVHVEAIEYLVESFDVANQIHPEDFLQDPLVLQQVFFQDFPGVFKMGTNEKTVCVYEIGSQCPYGVITVDNCHLRCLTCSSNKCNHIEYVLRMKNEEDYPSALDELFFTLDHPEAASCRNSTAVSWLNIPFNLSLELQHVLQLGIKQILPRNDQGVLLISHDRRSHNPVCPSCGSEWCEDADLNQLVHVITETEYLPAIAHNLKCSGNGCHQVLHYDGLEHGLLNMGSHVVSYDVLRSYMHHFLHGRCPMYTYYCVLSAKHSDAGDCTFRQSFSYSSFRAAWYHFLSLLDINYIASFRCPHCSKGESLEPDTIICDATSLSFRRELIQVIDKRGEKDDTEQVLEGSTFSDRVFIADRTCRKLLHRYAETAHSNDALKQFPDCDLEEVVHSLKTYCPPLAQLIHSFGNIVPCPGSYAPLLTALASPSPVCALLSPTEEVEDLVGHLCKGSPVKNNPIRWQLLQQTIPVVFRLMANLPPGTTSLPLEMRSVLEHMLHRAKTPFAKANLHHDVPSNDEDPCSYYPNLRKYRSRGLFKSDFGKKQAVCGKFHHGHPSLLPGIFTVFCPHGICYGFEVMVSHESPNVPFTLMRTRFRKAPSVVVYDNACNLHSYCMNRDPLFFKGTKFLVDRFHWNNHTACSMGYDICQYPQFTYLNSQVNEQANSGLSKLKAQLSYMNQENFLAHCKLYLFFKNSCKKQLLLPTGNDS